MIENAEEKQLHAFKGKTAEEWAKIEADEHDEEYRDAYPFGLKTYQFTPERAWFYEDYAYKKGRRRDRGHRTRKVFKLMDLENISGKRVLDIGCGIGQYSVLFAMKGAHVTGVELSQVGVETARKIAQANGVTDRCTFIQGDITKQKLEEESFDIVLLHEVFHHAIKYPKIRELINSLTKKGGKIIMADTVRGAGPIHLGRKLVKYCRRKMDPSSEEHEENLGDVLFDLSEYERFAKGYGYSKIFTMSYFYMVKQTFLQHHTDKFFVRWFLRSMKMLDDVLLTLFPFLKKGCGEAILYIEK